MTTCIRRGKMYQTIPFDSSKEEPGIDGCCIGCAALGDDPLCLSLPRDCIDHPNDSLIWIEIKNEKTDTETTARQRDPCLESA